MIKFPVTRRKSAAAHHNTLDPQADRAIIFEQLFLHEFPVEFLLAAEIAQFRTFTFPNGTALLHRTGQFEHDGVKRLDDTRAILVEMGKETFSSEHGQAMAEHLNQIHGFYDIPNDEFLHTLSTFIYDVCDMVNTYGWRKLTWNEQLAIYHTYVEMGELMHIEEIPSTFEAFRAWKATYEVENQAYAETNQKVAKGMLEAMKEMVPFWVRPFIAPFAFSLSEPHLPDLLGLKRPSPFVRTLVQTVMYIRRILNTQFTLWDRLDFRSLVLGSFKSYPNGYNPFQLGPEKLIRHIKEHQTAGNAPEGLHI